MLGNLGLVLGLALLIGLALRGMNILLAVLISIGVIGLTNAMTFEQIYLQYFPFGASGAFSFAGNFLLLFLCGAIFGRVMAASRAAQSVALAVTHWLGAERALWVAMLVCALLTYGGVVVFVVMFTMYPIGVTLMREANIPRRLYAAAIALGAGTFTMTAMPGTPSIHNVIGARALGTDLFAGAVVGLVASAVMITLGMWYLQSRWRKATAAGEGYESVPKDEQMRTIAQSDKATLPWVLAILPVVVVLLTILVPRLLLMAGVEASWIGFANGNPVLWASFALLLGAFSCFVMFSDRSEERRVGKECISRWSPYH